jgi:hypothetical protein
MPEKHSGLGHEGVLHSPRYAVLLCAALITASFAVSGAIAGATNSAPNSAASALTISNPPSASAPLSVWETWSYQQQAFMQGTNWVQALSTSRCQVTEVTVDSVTSDGSYGIPSGIVTDAVSGVETCSPTTAGDSISPLTSTDCPVQTSGNHASVTGGVACVGTATFNGNVNYMAASYLRTASTSSYGHAELGTVGGTCVVGTLVADQVPEVTLNTNQAGFVLWGPRSGSNNWSSTWWQDNGGGNYSDFGTVCGSC